MVKCCFSCFKRKAFWNHECLYCYFGIKYISKDDYIFYIQFILMVLTATIGSLFLFTGVLG